MDWDKLIGESAIYLADWAAVQRPGVSQAQLARECGVARQQWGRWWNGTTWCPREDALNRIAAVLQMDGEDLFRAPPRKRKRRGDRTTCKSKKRSTP